MEPLGCCLGISLLLVYEPVVLKCLPVDDDSSSSLLVVLFVVRYDNRRFEGRRFLFCVECNLESQLALLHTGQYSRLLSNSSDIVLYREMILPDTFEIRAEEQTLVVDGPRVSLHFPVSETWNWKKYTNANST